jgi:hypothetical protein
MTTLKFFVPYRAPHPEGEFLAANFFGAVPAQHGDDLGLNNMHYGILYAQDLRLRCRDQGKAWIHVDHGMFNRSTGLNVWDGFYRFSRESQSNTYCQPSTRDYERRDAFLKAGTLKVEPFREPKKGQILAYQPPSHFMRRFANLPPNFDDIWQYKVTQMWPDLEFRVYEKGIKGEEFYENLGAFASFNSSVSVECLQRGIPICIGGNRNYLPGKTHYWLGDDDVRMNALAYLAGRNFTVAEMKDGTAWWHMVDNGEIKTDRSAG